ncbi:glutamate racemase [uncultured Megasphaera sp.]|uniref:glutamate racemase n=1 Tax=uncultured Megasphaera sp. TaxID=165188 RepID=UPI0025997B29|nr:glutamate racemase [uncultured Megasphaera sp.]
MERNAQPIGVFDSGVGGLTVVAKLRMLLPHENIIYVGDTKRNPYGTRTPEEILAYTRDILRFMTAQGVKLVAIGCNTVTAVAYDTVVREVPYPLIGMSRGLRTAREISATKKVAVFATPLTIANHSHRKVAAAMDPDIEIVEQSCPALANLIERGVLDGPEIREPLKRYTEPVLHSGADTAIFGCTHFPFVQPLFEELCGDSIAFVDPAHEMALETLDVLKKDGLLNKQPEPGNLRLCFTAESGRGSRLAQHLIPANEFTAEEISLT